MDFISRFIEQNRLPESFLSVVQEHYLPLCLTLSELVQVQKQNSVKPFLLGVNGAQGTGKSTLADFIAEYFMSNLNESGLINVAVLSIDDFYLTKADREDLSEKVHPLLKTRGVPGTHDLDLAFDVMDKLLNGESNIALPRFDKGMDDRASKLVWPITSAPVDLVILEGWCVGATAQLEIDLDEPVNELERLEDENRVWRDYVNQSLSGEYQRLFNLIDCLILLKAPDFESVYRWRSEQEGKLAELIGEDAPGLMTPEQIARFIQHYERLTRHNLQTLPTRADVQFSLNRDHQIQ